MFPDYFRDDVFRLETQRLWLRWPAICDASAIERLAGEREIAEWTANIPHPYPKGAGLAFVVSAREANDGGSGLHLALALKQKPTSLIGLVSLEKDAAQVELGYWLGRPYWSAGLAYEALLALFDLIWLATDVARIRALVMPANKRSLDLLQRIGFITSEEPATCHAPARSGSIPAVALFLERVRPRFSAQDKKAKALSPSNAVL